MRITVEDLTAAVLDLDDAEHVVVYVAARVDQEKVVNALARHGGAALYGGTTNRDVRAYVLQEWKAGHIRFLVGGVSLVVGINLRDVPKAKLVYADEPHGPEYDRQLRGRITQAGDSLAEAIRVWRL